MNLAIMPRFLRPFLKLHPNRPGRWTGSRAEKLPVVDHRILRDTGNRLHAECISRGLSTYQADNMRGLFMGMARIDGHLQAYHDCTQRAAELAVAK
jgi:hypothetical protein